MHLHFMVISNQSLEEIPDGWPAKLNLLDPSHSLIAQSLQYLSNLLVSPGDCDRVLLICYCCGCDTFETFCIRCPEEVEIFQKTLLCLISALERRLWGYLVSEFKALQIGDMRLPQEVRRQIGLNIASRNRCCHGELDCHIYDHSKQQLALILAMAGSLLLLAEFIRASIYCIEVTHKLHQVLSLHGRIAFPTLCAKSLAVRARRRLEARQEWDRRRRRRMQQTSDGPPTPMMISNAAGSSSLDLTVLKRALSPLEVFRKRRRADAQTAEPNSGLPMVEANRIYADMFKTTDAAEKSECEVAMS